MASFTGFFTSLFDAVTERNQGKRRVIYRNTQDAKKTITSYSRMEAMGLARWAYSNDGFTRGAVDMMARYVVGRGITPQAATPDPDWNAQAEDWWDQESRALDVTGLFRRFDRLLEQICRAVDLDGDIGYILLDDPRPRIQMVEGHRVGGFEQGQDMWDGVQIDALGRPVSYRLLLGDFGSPIFRDVPAATMRLVSEQRRVHEYRSITSLIHGLTNIQDLKEILDLEKMGTKTSVAPGLIHKTDDEDDDLLGNDDPDQSLAAVVRREVLYGGTIVRIKTGDDIRAVDHSRPNTGLADFSDVLLKPVATGLGLPIEFVYDMARGGGAAARAVVAQAQRRFEQRQDLLIEQVLDPLWSWSLAKGIALGELPPNPLWYRVAWQRPQSLTVDFGRDSKETRNDVWSGQRTLEEDCGERGFDWKDVLEQRAIELAFVNTLSAKYGVPSERIHPPGIVTESIRDVGTASPDQINEGV